MHARFRRAMIAGVLAGLWLLSACQRLPAVEAPATAAPAVMAEATPVEAAGGATATAGSPSAVALATVAPTATAAATATRAPAPPAAPAAPTVAVTSPAAAPSQSATAPGQAGGKIFYLAADGGTINTIRPDGSDVQFLLTVDKGPNEIVVDLSGEPSGTFLIYGVAPAKQARWPRYFLVQNGVAAPLPSFRTVPRWSPDGRRFVAQMVGEADAPGPIYLYDTATGVGTTLAAGVPDWFPDGSRLVYVAGDIWTFDLASGAGTRLTELPTEGDEMWFVQEAHVLPGGEYIVFYGGQRKSVGASGNGQQWWWIPAGGGQPQPYSGQGGNLVLGYASKTTGDMIAYAESAHSSACVSEQRILARSSSPEGGVAVEAPIPATIERSSSAALYIKGFSWEPDGHRIAYAVQQYRCVPGATELVTEPAVIYTWLAGQGFGVEGGAPRKLIKGAYPVWIR